MSKVSFIDKRDWQNLNVGDIVVTESNEKYLIIDTSELEELYVKRKKYYAFINLDSKKLITPVIELNSCGSAHIYLEDSAIVDAIRKEEIKIKVILGEK